MERAFVKLTEDEWDALVFRAADLYASGQVDSETEALRAANAQQPEDRRIKGSPNGIFPSRYKAWGERWTLAVANARGRWKSGGPSESLSDSVGAVMEKIREEKAAEPAPAPIPDPVRFAPAEPKPTDLLSEFLKGLLIEALESERGQEALRNAFRVRAGVPDMSPGAKPVSPTAPVPQRKRSVLIVGLLGSQATEIMRAFGDIFDLRFMTSDAAHTQAKHAMKQVDTVMGMIGYIDHSVFAVLKKAKDFKYVNGTVSDLKRVLTGMSNV